MAQFSVEIFRKPGSLLRGNQQSLMALMTASLLSGHSGDPSCQIATEDRHLARPLINP